METMRRSRPKNCYGSGEGCRGCSSEKSRQQLRGARAVMLVDFGKEKEMGNASLEAISLEVVEGRSWR